MLANKSPLFKYPNLEFALCGAVSTKSDCFLAHINNKINPKYKYLFLYSESTYHFYTLKTNVRMLDGVTRLQMVILVITWYEYFVKNFFTFRVPYSLLVFDIQRKSIMIYSYNRSQQDALFLNFILTNNSTCFG